MCRPEGAVTLRVFFHRPSMKSNFPSPPNQARRRKKRTSISQASLVYGENSETVKLDPVSSCNLTRETNAATIAVNEQARRAQHQECRRRRRSSARFPTPIPAKLLKVAGPASAWNILPTTSPAGKRPRPSARSTPRSTSTACRWAFRETADGTGRTFELKRRVVPRTSSAPWESAQVGRCREDSANSIGRLHQLRPPVSAFRI